MSRWIAIGSIAALLAVASLIVPEVWALPYAPLPRALTAAMILAAVIAFFLQWRQRGDSLVSAFLFRDNQQRTIAWAAMLLIAAGAAIVPMQTFFYGDGGLLIPQIFRLAKGEPYQTDILLNAKSSPLAGLLILGLSHGIPSLASILGAALPETGLYPFFWNSLICLTGLVAGLLLLVRREERLLYTLYLFGTAGTLFYFGYVEFYALAYTLIILYLLAAVRYIRGKAAFWLPAGLYVLAVFAHYESLALLHSMLYLAGIRLGYDRTLTMKTIAWFSFATAGLWVIAYFATGLYSADSRIVMPFVDVHNASGVHSYTLLSFSHLRDLLNIVLLLAPVQFVMIAAAAAQKNRVQLSEMKEARFFFLALFFFAAFVFFANTSLGLARDWDIAAPLGIIVACAAAVFHTMKLPGADPGARPALYYAGFGALIVAGSWGVSNVNPSMSAARFETILSIDANRIYRDYSHSGYEALRKYFVNERNLQKDIQLSQKKIEILDYPQDYAYLITRSLEIHPSDATEYTGIQRWMLLRLAAKAQSLNSQGTQRDYSISMPQIDSLAEAIAVNAYTLRCYTELSSGIAQVARETGAAQPYSTILALEAYESKDYAAALRGFGASIERGFHSPQIFRLAATALALSKRYSDAIAAIEKGIGYYPDDPRLLMTYGDWLLKSGIRRDDAVAALQKAFALAPDDQLRQQIQRILESSGTPPPITEPPAE